MHPVGDRITLVQFPAALILATSLAALRLDAQEAQQVPEQQVPEQQVDVVVATAVRQVYRPADPQAEEPASRELADLSSFVPMPLPRSSRDLTKQSSTPGAVVVYDLVLRREEVVDGKGLLGRDAGRLPTTAITPGSAGGASRPLSPVAVNPKGFGGLTRVSDTTAAAYRKHVQLVSTAGGSSYLCSGTLIDARHVLTAGHCIHDGGTAGDWVDSVAVIPGADGGNKPYGAASAVSLLAWTEWTENKNLDFDLGVIEVDRPVGAITGWRSFGTTNIAGYFLSGDWEQPGYPFGGPGDGLTMFTWTGHYDSCDSFFGFFGTKCGHDRETYGGQSGAGAIKDGVTWAVHSHVIDNMAQDVSVVKPIYDDILAGISSNTPSSPDLVPLYVQVVPDVAFSGTLLESLDYLVHNNSKTPVSGTFDVYIYASDNDVITAGDTLIQTHQFTYDFGSKNTVRVHVTDLPMIPYDMSGDVWIGIVLDFVDVNEGNNVTDGDDASKILIDNNPAILFLDGFESGDLTAWV